ncbi:uncharacterized protein [Physcomitrium patens]|uniref:Translation initiation factor IF-3 n=1 Tax=Physcomitrium patens TaxID=3218 RepID=A9RKX4_PHYPA|nr:uncharacterized protein LOC112293070 [Physcomitrium patens]PNR37883.1 hypothetical protein PHYPA_020993 [Physcomitrium patens]|eukprot:XP_024397896.1 uncharacterized protein LOC112293070 [Physcomitrella patens]
MRQKVLSWLVSRIFSGRHLDLGENCFGFGACNRGLAEVTTKRFSRSFLSAVRGEYAVEGFRAVEVPWSFRNSRGFAAPVVTGGSGGGSSSSSSSSNIKGGNGEGNRSDRKINRAIVARMVRLVGADGHEILSRYEALNRAQQEGLDLVEVDGKADPPVCKLMDFSRERFKVKKQEKDLRKKQLERRRLDDLKEVRFSSRTEQKDLEMKADVVTRLLTRGHRVKLAVQFHGNDKGEEVGVELLERAMRLLGVEVKVENGPRVEKMRAWVMIRPIQEQRNSKNKKASKTIREIVDADDLNEEDTNMKAVKEAEG